MGSDPACEPLQWLFTSCLWAHCSGKADITPASVSSWMLSTLHTVLRPLLRWYVQCWTLKEEKQGAWKGAGEISKSSLKTGNQDLKSCTPGFGAREAFEWIQEHWLLLGYCKSRQGKNKQKCGHTTYSWYFPIYQNAEYSDFQRRDMLLLRWSQNN